MEFLIYALLSVKNNSGKLKPLLAGIKGIFGESLFAVHFDTVGDVDCASASAGEARMPRERTAPRMYFFMRLLVF